MKAYITKDYARGELTVKAGEVHDLKPEAFAVLASEGYAITETEHAATVKARQEGEDAIKAAIVRAKARNAIPAKDDAVQATSLEQFTTGQATSKIVVQLIDGMQGKAEQDLAVRATAFQQEQNGAPMLQYGGRFAKADPRDCAVKACDMWNSEKQFNLIKAGKAKEATELSREASVIIANEIMPIVKAGGDFVLRDIVRAADTTDANVGTIATGLILMRNLGYLKNMIGFTRYISTDLRNEPALFNQPVFSRYITPPAVTAYNTTTGWADSTPSTTDVTVTMNKHKGVQITFQTQLLGSTVRNLLTEQQSAQTYALGEEIVKDFLTTIFGTVWAGTVTKVALGNNFNLSSLVTLKNRATLAKLPEIGRFVLLHSFYHDAILTDSNLVSAKAITALVNKDLSALESAELPTLYGLKPLESQLSSAKDGTLTAPNISADGSTVDFAGPGVNQVGFLGNQASALMVARVPQDYTQAFKDIPATAAIQVVTDPDTGLSMLNCRYVNHQLAQVSNRLSLMYGFAAGDKRQGFILTP